MSRSLTRGASRWRRALAMTVLVGALATSTAPAGQEEESSPAAVSTLGRIAETRRQELEQRQGTSRAPEEMIERLLSRFFAVYLLPEDPAELGRLLGAAERIADRAAVLFWRAAQATAAADGAKRVTPGHLRDVFGRLLPSTVDPWDRVVFFGGAAATPVETWDLAAFFDTGFAWEALIRLGERESVGSVGSVGSQGVIDWEPEAVRTMAGAVNAYGLLLFRLGGEHARAELAPYLRTEHLRAAFKTIAARASGEPALIGSLPASDGGPTTSEPLFDDVTDAAGIDFRHVTSPWLSRFRRYGPIAPTFSGGGVAVEDFDGDGWPDLVFCGGRGCGLWRNRGEGTFEDVTERAGIGRPGEARMPLGADFDNDGLPDLFVTYAGEPNRLYRNRGDGGFEEWTAEAGLPLTDEISGPAVALDADGDGWLDLYVGNFGDYRKGELPWTSPDARNGQPNRLFLNLGGETGELAFVDRTEAGGVGDPGWAQAVSHLDLDGDGDQDLYVANDFGRNELFLNRGDGTFAAAGAASGSDDPHHGMNVAFADLNHDRRPEIFISNIWAWSPALRRLNESNTLLIADRPAGETPIYRAAELPVLREHDSGWAWAALFLDADNDGDDDLAIANGFTDYLVFTQYREHPELPGQLYPITHRREPNLLLLNQSAPAGEELVFELRPGSGLELEGRNSRSLATLDYDRDGDLDLAVTTFHDTARLLENRGAGGAWLRLRLRGEPARGDSRDAIGAVVVASPSDSEAPPVWRAVTGGEGYLGRSEPMVALGLGGAGEVNLEIDWPAGGRQRLLGLPVGRHLEAVQLRTRRRE